MAAESLKRAALFRTGERQQQVGARPRSVSAAFIARRKSSRIGQSNFDRIRNRPVYFTYI
jgi:hypothetical protein